MLGGDLQLANQCAAINPHALQVGYFGRNVFDERGVLTRGNPAFGSHLTLIRPREIGVEARYTFN